MAVDQSTLDDLEEAYFSGMLSVRTSDGKSVTYASLEDLWAAILRLRQMLAPASKKAPISGRLGYKRY